MQTWKTLSRRTVLEHGKFLTVEEHAVQLPDGRVISDWPWVITPDFVNILPITTEGAALVFRQPKYAIEGIVLAPVGGYLEPGEEPLATAKRELLEETGYEAPDWVGLGSYRVGGNRGIAMAHLFLARGAKRMQEPQKGDELEEQEQVQLSLRELESALANGEFKVLAWATLVALALRHLQPGA